MWGHAGSTSTAAPAQQAKPSTGGGNQHRVHWRNPRDALRMGMWVWEDMGMGACATVPGTGHPMAGQSARCRDSASQSWSVLVPSHPRRWPYGTTTDLCSAQDELSPPHPTLASAFHGTTTTPTAQVQHAAP